MIFLTKQNATQGQFFKAEFNRFEFKVVLLDQLPYQGKFKQPHPGFELRLQYPFLMMVNHYTMSASYSYIEY